MLLKQEGRTWEWKGKMRTINLLCRHLVCSPCTQSVKPYFLQVRSPCIRILLGKFLRLRWDSRIFCVRKSAYSRPDFGTSRIEVLVCAAEVGVMASVVAEGGGRVELQWARCDGHFASAVPDIIGLVKTKRRCFLPTYVAKRTVYQPATRNRCSSQTHNVLKCTEVEETQASLTSM